MSDTTQRTFEYKDDKSSKFWEVTQSGSTVKVRFGKTGANGQSQEKVFADEAAASKHIQKLIAEKTGKGYVELGKSSMISVDATDAVVVEKASEPGPQKGQTKPKSVKPAKPKNPVQEPDATPESLMALLDKDDSTNRMLAKHPKASAELLEKLSHSSDKATRQAVCLNPNASKGVLSRLAPQFPGEFFLNPAFDWLLLEDPDFLFKLGQGVLKNILKRPECPVSFMKWALQRGSEAEQLALTMNPSVPSDILHTLAQRKGSVGDAARGRAEVKGGTESDSLDLDNVYITELKKALSDVKPDEVLSAWKRDMITSAHWPWLSLECRLLVSELPLSMLMAGVIRGHEDELAKHSSSNVRELVARFVESPPKLLETLASDSSHHVRAAMASNPHCPDSSLEMLVKDKQAAVRAAAACNVKVTAEQAIALAADVSPIVREAVIPAWCLPAEALQVLALEKAAAIRKPALNRLEELSNPAVNPKTSPEELTKIALSAKAATKILLAANPATPIEWIKQYANEGNTSLDKALLKNPCLPSDVAETVYRRHLETLGPKQTTDFIEKIRIPLAIRELAAEKAWMGRWPKCKNWRQEAFEVLCEPWAGADPNGLLFIPKGMEAQYAGSALRCARLLGLAHPRTPPELLIKRSNSVDWAERLAIARNTSLPPNLVAKFKKDPHKLVADQAQVTEKAKAKIKDRQAELLADASASVDWGSIVQLLQEEISTKGVRPWEWFGTPWWPQLSLKQRLGYYRVQRGYGIYKEPDLEGFFAALPYSPEQLFGCRPAEIRQWLAGFKGTPLKLLEEMFASDKNSVAQDNWLSRVRIDVDPDLPEKLRIAVAQTSSWGAKWGGFKEQLMRHPDTPVEALIELASAVENKSDAERYLNIPTLPQVVREVLSEISQAKQVKEISAWASSSKADDRRLAATHPLAPFNVLEQLIKDKNKEVRLLAETNQKERKILEDVESYYTSENLSSKERAEKIKALATIIQGQTTEFRNRVCALERCSPDLLEAISRQKDLWSIAQTLAKNPIAPEVVLSKLTKLSRQSEWPRDVCKELCANPSMTVDTFRALLESKSDDVRAEVAAASKTPKELVAGLENDPSPLVRAAIARRLDLEFDLKSKLSKDPNASVRKVTAERNDLDSDLRVQLAMDSDFEVVKAALSHRGLSIDFYKKYFQAGGRKVNEYSIQEIQEAGILELLANEGESLSGYPGGRLGCRIEVAKHPAIPYEILEFLTHDSEISVVAATLSNPMIPEKLMRKVLEFTDDNKCWEAIQQNPFSPPDLLDISVKKVGENRYWAKSWYVQKLSGGTRNEQTETFLVQAMEWAHHPKLPLDRLRSLAASGIWVIRWAAASNLTLPQEESLAIREELWAEVHEALFGPDEPPLSTKSLGEDTIRAALMHLDLMPHAEDKRAIAAAAKSPEVLCRVAAALSPGVQPSVLKMLLEDPVETVKALAVEKLRALEATS